MEDVGEIASVLKAGDPLVLALVVALAGIALGGMALWVLLRLNGRGGSE
jgi:hypothetical protein